MEELPEWMARRLNSESNTQKQDRRTEFDKWTIRRNTVLERKQPTTIFINTRQSGANVGVLLNTTKYIPPYKRNNTMRTAWEAQGASHALEQVSLLTGCTEQLHQNAVPLMPSVREHEIMQYSQNSEYMPQENFLQFYPFYPFYSPFYFQIYPVSTDDFYNLY